MSEPRRIGSNVLKYIFERRKLRAKAKAICNKIASESERISVHLLASAQGHNDTLCPEPGLLYHVEFTCPPDRGPGEHACLAPAGYDCGEYKCLNNYTCSSEKGLDHHCGKSNVCGMQFDCDAGHAHMCRFEDGCGDTFTCSAGGQECPAKYSGEKDPPGGGGPAPGDFLCGDAPANGFVCNNEFTCQPLDDFDCDGENGAFGCLKDFTCSPEKGEKGDFYCYNNNFQCRDVFSCQANVQCHREPSEYVCPGTYEPPKDGYYKDE